ncbi:MAG TPA: DUF4199 domain-containing protein [Candidatus Angelobacter sp.]|nr:DUF4199 domain-containing protein [Candidatus Angelobacter sp.]
MKKAVWTFGLISGAIAAGTMLATLPLADSPRFKTTEVFGFTAIVLSALMIFFGIRSYRDNVGAGKLTFGRGIAVGLLIALISSACYVGTWELIYFKLKPGFAEKYAAHLIERARASWQSQEKIDQAVREAQGFKQMYDKPLNNIAITFSEIFPIGLLVTLISAGILRKKGQAQAAL